VVLKHTGQGRLVADLADPARQLRVPEQSVTTDQLAVLGGPVNEVVSLSEVEAATAWLGSIPLEQEKRAPR
jgi:hypothetical protein